MGNIEVRAKKRKQKRDIQHAVLAAIGTAGVLSIALVAPNIFQALPHILGKEQYKLRFQAKNATHRLLIKGWVKRNARGMLEITDQGRRQLAIREATLSSPAATKRKWDKQYRLVMFDMRLQDSVWVSPYDCEDIIALVKANLAVGKEIIYAVVSEIENDGVIRRHFDLS
jgi:hypothetical protein